MDRPSKSQCKWLRVQFREGVLARDRHCCRICGAGHPLDVHHITPRRGMPNDGYALENGITLCKRCHEKAELCLQMLQSAQSSADYPTRDETWERYEPEQLYELIGSSPYNARVASEKLL